MTKTNTIKYIFFMLPVIGIPILANAVDILNQGVSEVGGSKFNYSVIDVGLNERRIEVAHAKEKYDGSLAETSFRDRHLQVFGMVAGLIKGSCQNGVSSLGKVTISRDPEQDEDQDAEHPQYFIWEYSCK
ncbi:hypothetical protein [Mesorhizobium sp.]|uniref:hypothetical protein n=1 Tax=Mesorhizobium sp. TaxID=1871066 RepID=UPI00257AD4C8|nr:hypothetical protein [Mesorhizobium sp.]